MPLALARPSWSDIREPGAHLSTRKFTEPDPEQLAEAAGLTYTRDTEPGIRRQRRGRGFSYHAPDGSLVTDPDVRERIHALAIPPAWTEVWISCDPEAHISATGRDGEGRKQYIYHPVWRERRDELKFQRVVEFGRALPRLRLRVGRDLRRSELSRRKVLAAAVRVLDRTGIRPGSEAYENANDSYGLTTLRRKHLRIDGTCVRLTFEGKGGRPVEVQLTDESLSGVLRSCNEMPGHRIFQYLDERGDPRSATPEEVNAYIADALGAGFTSKDFRTWAATVRSLVALASQPEPDPDDRAALGEALDAAMEEVAEALGNTARVAREAYVHPLIVRRFLEGGFGKTLVAARRTETRYRRPGRLREERLLLAFVDAA